MPHFECPTCGMQFDSRRGLGVHHSTVHDERLPNRTCDECGADFYCDYERKYCSKECVDEAVSFSGADNPNYSDAKETADCDICGEEFEYYPCEKPGFYCPECVETEPWRPNRDITGEKNPRWSGGKLTLTCDVCDATVERHPSMVSGEVVLCGRECHAEWLSETFTGEGHPNWRGGTNPNYGQGWAEVRRRALERDDHACVICGTDADDLGRNPDVHHVVPVRLFVESPVLIERDAHTLDNVVSLCPGCHRRAEFGGHSRAELWDRAGIGPPARPAATPAAGAGERAL